MKLRHMNSLNHPSITRRVMKSLLIIKIVPYFLKECNDFFNCYPITKGVARDGNKDKAFLMVAENSVAQIYYAVDSSLSASRIKKNNTIISLCRYHNRMELK